MASKFEIQVELELGNLRGQIKRLEGQMDAAGKRIGSSESGIMRGIKRVGGALAAAVAVEQLGELGKRIINVTAEMQKMSAVLTNTLGSRSEAQKSLNMISKWASKTNFSVFETTEAFVKLANFGMVATADELTRLGDLANSTGKGFDQLVEAVIDAQSGEFERLKEFGIRASSAGDKVTFTFKGVETQVSKTDDAIREYILGLGELEGVKGSTAAISNTLEGRLSNMGDAFNTALSKMGTEAMPLINAILPKLEDFIADIGDKGFLAAQDLVVFVNTLIELYNNSLALQVLFAGLVFALETVWTTLKTVGKGIWSVIELIIRLGSAIVNPFKPANILGAKAAWEKFQDDVLGIGTTAADEYSDAWSRATSIIGKKLKKLAGDFANFERGKLEGAKTTTDGTIGLLKTEQQIREEMALANQLSRAETFGDVIAIVVKEMTLELMKSIIASVPFPFSIALAAGAGALVNSLVSGLQGFATGGVVGGSSFSGDNVMIRANSGERVLNIPQQQFLMEAANAGRAESAETNNLLRQIVMQAKQPLNVYVNQRASDFVNIHRRGVAHRVLEAGLG